MLELFAIWNYKGKCESKHWKLWEIIDILDKQLASPPAKMIRYLLFTAGENLLPCVHAPTAPEPHLSRGKTSSILFKPIEEVTDTRVKAAQDDDANVDLSQWSYPNETPGMVGARAVLCFFVVNWWAHHQEKIAFRWLESIGNNVTLKDIEGVTDCICWVKACTYWTWVRGSYTMF